MGDLSPFDRKPRPWPPRRSPSGFKNFFNHAGFFALAVVVAGGIYFSDFWQGMIAPEHTRAENGTNIAEEKVGNRVVRHVTGPAYNAIDGDSLRTNRDDIRLLGIDAPELYQTCRNARGQQWACGREAQAKLKSLVSRGDVRCTSTARDRFNRVLSVCSAGPVTDLAEAMVRDGFAVNFMNGRYAAAEAEARRARRGIWAGQFEQPQEWRRRNPRGDRG